MKSFSKSNFVKVIGATTLATLIATAGIFAFAPLSANTQVNSNNSNLTANAQNNETTTEPAGLITPQTDDPVLFTTESGLEIKYGNATITSGGLAGFSYFTTTNNNINYDWVIIGHNGLAENLTPAGNAIILEFSKQYINGQHSATSTNLASGEVLCLLNIGIDCVWSNTGYSARKNYFNSNLCSLAQTYVNEDYFGMGNLLLKLQTVDYKCGYYDTNYSSGTRTGTVVFFPLNITSTNAYAGNFQFGYYLTKAQYASTKNIWTGYYSYMNSRSYVSAINTSGEQINLYETDIAMFRPACVLKL